MVQTTILRAPLHTREREPCRSRPSPSRAFPSRPSAASGRSRRCQYTSDRHRSTPQAQPHPPSEKRQQRQKPHPKHWTIKSSPRSSFRRSNRQTLLGDGEVDSWWSADVGVGGWAGARSWIADWLPEPALALHWRRLAGGSGFSAVGGAVLCGRRNGPSVVEQADAGALLKADGAVVAVALDRIAGCVRERRTGEGLRRFVL